MESTITPKLATSISEAATNSSSFFDRYGFLQPGYWFGTPSIANLDQLLVFVIASGLILIFVLLLVAYKLLRKSLTPPENKLINKIIWYLIWFGPLGLALVLFRYVGIVFLSARFWWVIWLLAIFVVAWLLFKEYKKLDKLNEQYQTYLVKKRYFVNKKKKR